jgi:hypothetical protein
MPLPLLATPLPLLAKPRRTLALPSRKRPSNWRRLFAGPLRADEKMERIPAGVRSILAAGDQPRRPGGPVIKATRWRRVEQCQ